MENIKKNYGIDDPMMHGLKSRKSELQQGHPLEESEKNFDKNCFAQSMDHLRMMQGIHAPLRIMMEHQAVLKVGHLPCISQRSNALADVLSGRDEMIAPEDIYGRPENHEGLAMPHNVIEKHLGGPF